MTTLNLEPIKERLAAATPGPWEMSYDADDKWTSITGQPYDDGGQWLVCPEVATCEGEPDADSTLIAHAPEDIAALVAEVERLRATIHVLTSERDSALERNNDLIDQSEKQQSRLSAVEKLHRRSTYKSDEPYCETCYQAPYGYAPYPCPTIRALEVGE